RRTVRRRQRRCRPWADGDCWRPGGSWRYSRRCGATRYRTARPRGSSRSRGMRAGRLPGPRPGTRSSRRRNARSAPRSGAGTCAPAGRTRRCRHPGHAAPARGPSAGTTQPRSCDPILAGKFPCRGCIGAALTAIKCGRDDTGLPIRIGRPAMAADRTPGSTTTSAAPIIAGLVPGFDGLRFRHWQVEARADGVVVVTIDREGQAVNALSQAMLVELGELLERLAIDPPRGVVFRSGKSSGFIAGADVKEFQDFDARGTVNDALFRGQQVLQKLASLPCPTVATIHGYCMGGGTELALACRYRIASSDESTRIGLPEVKLGIYPGWGGSVRLPRLVGAPAAMDVMLSGRTLSAKAALAMGVVDRVVEPSALLDAAAVLALQGHARAFKQRALAWASNTWPVRQLLAPMLVKQVARKAPKAHYPAPYALIETWRRAGGGIQSLLTAERKAVAKLAGTPTARNLIRVFFLQERLKGQGAGDSGIARVHVVGAGVMGGDIAAWAAYKGFEVTLADREQRFIDGALQRAQGLFAKKV